VSKRKGTRAIKNNLYALKLLWKICPSLVIHQAMTRVLGYFEWLFYSAFFMRYVINALETEQEFIAIMTFLGITVAVFMAMNLYYAYVEGKVMLISKENVYKELNLMLFDKAINVELTCFEDLLCLLKLFIKNAY